MRVFTEKSKTTAFTKRLRGLFVYIPVVLSHTHTQTVILPSHKRHMSKTLSTKTTTRGQDQHIPARPYEESKSITHAQTPTQALLAFTSQTHRPKRVHINARENACLKYFNYPLVWNSYF